MLSGPDIFLINNELQDTNKDASAISPIKE